ncbi:uncharacterized protein J7T54_002990 [Emericellopsis cladophorae]|uniref:Integral membrane protein n=1 Tax=Emericellopsis cladophorae TaxID=2686198 RepID=A0A9P9XYY7_9HYPO|nr:uncharacterized protein J7T54_002990 [Emericellopsis cladophorae]KAI6780211.1 hypothetical protein J7T54_002990 [Emericellopsis cladophorae]
MIPNSTLFILGLLFLYAGLVEYARLTCWRDPTSKFYAPKLAHTPAYSRHRIHEAKKYAAQLAAEKPEKPVKMGIPDLCVGITSVSRDGVAYLKTSLASLNHGLSPEEQSRVRIVVLLAHTNKTQHPDHDEPWLPLMADKVVYYDDNADWLDLATRIELENNHPVKHKLDYSIVLEECQKTGAPYTIMAEDDVIFLDGWRHRVMEALDAATEKAWSSSHREFFYLRLFWYDQLRGWNAESWPTYLFWSSMVAGCVAGALHFTRKAVPAVRRTLTRPICGLVIFVFTPMLILLYFAAGRNCMQPPAEGVTVMERNACCGQGLAFPRNVIEHELLPSFHNNRWSETPADSFIEDYARATGGLRYALTPVIVQHVGGKSSYGAKRGKLGIMTPGKIWNFGFERHDPQVLAREHEQVLQAEMMARDPRERDDVL